MKIAIIVQGRFHAFELAGALIKRGHDVTVLTNYPKWAARKFGLPVEAIRGFWLHGVLFRVSSKLSLGGMLWDTARCFDPLFARWAAARIRERHYDVVHAFSGVALESLRSRDKATVHLIVRGSCHIAMQDRLLYEEGQRARQRVERPSPTIMKREEREYIAADRIITLSKFAYDSFLSHGIQREKLELLPLGVDTRHFRASEEIVNARCARIRKGSPLRVLLVGTMSLQKGLLDFVSMVDALGKENFRFRFVGTVSTNRSDIIKKLSDVVEFIPRQKQWDLPQQYAWGDIFIYPTIQDGFAAVLAQAGASALPIIGTTNCAAPDMIQPDETGWIVPIRSPEAFVQRLRWCDQNRDALATMIMRIANQFKLRTWDDVARDFERICKDATLCQARTESVKT